jgi:hypothetical protein
MKNRSSQSLAVRALLVSLFAAGTIPAMAEAVPGMHWTHTGSTGTVDPADMAATLYDFDVIQNVGPAAGTVHVRYNVVAVDGLQTIGGEFGGFTLAARYRDQGTLANVVARLWQVSLATGERTPIAVLDSNAFPQSFSFQKREVGVCNISFDFTQYTYYVGVHLVRGTQAGTVPGLPALAGLQIRPGC